MPIQPGDKLPVAPIKRVDQDSFEDTDTGALFAGRDVVLFAVPGAFTPTCSERHIPGFVANYPAFRDKGIDVACMSVNDAFVMGAWGRSRLSEMVLGGTTRFLFMQSDVPMLVAH